MNFTCWADGTWKAGSWVVGSWCPSPVEGAVSIGGGGRVVLHIVSDMEEEELLALMFMELLD